jgi:predicted dehydrogenase
MTRIRVAVVGCGHLGTIHARLLAARPDTELVAVVDPFPESRGKVAAEHRCAALTDPRELVGRVDAAVVAAPTGQHAAVALPLLAAGIDLLIEKPIAATVEEAREIVTTARRYGRTVAVGHVERFNPAWKLAIARAGRIVSLESVRLAPFTYRCMDVGVVHDLMIHDIDLLLSLEPGRLERVDAQGLHATGGHEDAVRAQLVFASGMVASLTASRIHPTLRRGLTLWSSEGVVTVDLHAKSVEVVAPSPAVRRGEYVAADVPLEHRVAAKEAFFTDVLPRETLAIPESNAIAGEHDDFLSAIRDRRSPLVPASAGAAALEIANHVIDSLHSTTLGGGGCVRPTVPLPARLRRTG